MILLVESWFWSWSWKQKSKKMLWNKTEVSEHHQHVKHNFIINDYQKWYPDLDPDQNLIQSKDSNRLIENRLFQIFFQITHSFTSYSSLTNISLEFPDISLITWPIFFPWHFTFFPVFPDRGHHGHIRFVLFIIIILKDLNWWIKK